MASVEKPWVKRLSLVLLLGLALLLRLLKLDAELWYDEILTLVNFVRLPLGELVTTYTSLNNHVLYSLEAKAALALFGEHPWSLRLPAALFGVGSIYVAYQLAREAVGPWEARFAALLLTLSYHHVWFSQNARGYTGLLFFSLLGTLVFVRAPKHGSRRPWLLYAATIALAGYTHLTAALFFASHAIVWAGLLLGRRFLSVERRQAWEPYAAAAGSGPLLGLGLGAGLTALLYAPVVPSMLGTFQKVTGSPAGQLAKAAVRPSDGQWKNPLWTLLEVVRGFGDLGPLLVLAVPVAVALLVVGAVSLCRRNRLLAWVYLVNVPFTLVVLVLAGFRLWPRYFFLDIAFLLLCLSRGMFASVNFLAARFGGVFARHAPLVGRLGAGLAVLASLALLPKNYAYPKQNFEGALRYVEARRLPGDQVAAFGLARVPYSEYYHPPWTMVADAAELERVRAQPGRTFVVYAFTGHAKSRHPDLMAVVDAEFTRDRKFVGTLGDGDVIVVKSDR